MLPLPIELLLFMCSGWVSRHQQQTIDYLMAENAALREQFGGKRPRFTDAQCRRLPRAAKTLGRTRLTEGGLVDRCSTAAQRTQTECYCRMVAED